MRPPRADDGEPVGPHIKAPSFVPVRVFVRGQLAGHVVG